ncbi:MAG: class I poly(R)-hydroxyalkanoic acid synthase [Proteobacteria bacterium]|nr:MAG: class I poly(R)-hydroxyalkanoic acid synthase [Pseudomonadota bacterium]
MIREHRMTQKPDAPGDPDMNELTRQWMDLWAQGARTMTDFWGAIPGLSSPFASPVEHWQKMVHDIADASINSSALTEAQLKMWQDSMKLWAGMADGQADSVIQPERGDRRFRSDRWNDGSVFDFMKQSYLLAARYIEDVVESVEGLDEKRAHQLAFYARQYADALSPTNFALTNPDVLNETVESNGQNLMRGFNNLVEDLKKGEGKLRITMTDTSAFELGKNVATTPGAVVYQNELMQLIQYAPTTEKSFKRPLLIIPPWINKFYILDLRPENSFIQWAVSQGHTVFVVSWVNPDASLADRGFEDYLNLGPIAAMDAMERATGERSFNVIGYCLGGTLLAALLSYNKSVGDDRVKAATFFTSMIDFSVPGDLGVYIDEMQLASLEKKMEEQGYLEGSDMSNAFNMLRSNDLIWSFVINNYLLGKDPAAFDLLYWNSDSTRMPARMHREYLRTMYLENRFKEPGGMVLNGVPIDVSSVETPSYFLSTVEDHIAPWVSTYMGATLFRGPVKFVLGGSGHIAGVVNPADSTKYGYWTRPGKLIAKAEDWLDGATRNEGSWWPDWARWIKRHAGAQVPARQPGDGELEVIEPAPGSYVKLRLDAQKPGNCLGV